ncbi:MAG: EamA family transporter [Gemmatimonadaceae bacterium]
MGSVPRAKLIAAFAAIYIIWGSTYLGILFAIQTIPPLLMAGVRFSIAGLLLYAWARRGNTKPTRLQWRNCAMIGALLLLGGNGGVVLSERLVPSGLAALLVAALPMWTVILEWARPKGTKPNRGVIAGLILGLIGLVFLIGPSALQPSSSGGISIAGVVLLTFAEVSWASGSLLSQHVQLPKSSMLATAMQMISAGAIFLAISFIIGEPMRFDISHVSAKSLGGLLYLITFGSLVAFTAYVWLLKVSTPAKVSTYAYVNPIVALFLGWAFAGERLAPQTALASAIIIAAVALITSARNVKA